MTSAVDLARDGWRPVPLKYLASTYGGAGFPIHEQGLEDEALPFHKVSSLSGATDDGFIDASNDSVSYRTAAALRAPILRAGAIVIAKIGAALLLGRVRQLRQAATIDNNMLGIVPSKADDRFLFYAVQTVPFDLLVNPGAVPSLSDRNLRMWKVLVPLREEQRQIAEYLDRETGKIDALIAKQEQLVETLLERRSALTKQALSRGLAESEELRDSGVAWLGAVPSRWVVQPLGRLIAVTSGFPFKSELFTSDPEDTRLLRGVNINPGRTKWDEVARWRRKSNDGLDEYELSVGDIVLGLDRPIVSAGMRIARIEKSDLPALVLQRVARIRPRTGIDASFVYLLLSAQAFVDYLTPIFTGVSVPHMSPDQLKGYTVAIPPLDQQIEIVRHVAESNYQIGRLMEKASVGTQLLRERRQALISAAVTGKIDVRGL